MRLSCENKNLLNTNVISSDELIFSLDYLNNNVKITSTFINELTKNYGIDTIIIEKMEFVSTILNVLKNNTNIINLIIKEDVQLNFNICELIIKTNIKM